MWVKLGLLLLFCLMILSAVHFAQPRESEKPGASGKVVHSFKLLTWNIGYAELEDDTRAHDKDLPAVAEVILREDADAVALQELTGNPQLKILLRLLHGKYQGAVAQQGKADRFEAVLVKDAGARFIRVPVGDRYALGVSFKRGEDTQEVLVDWAKDQAQSSEVFIAGDFNFELKAANETNLYTDNLKHDSESYSYILRHFRDLGRAAGDTAINDRRIDYIFGPPALGHIGRVEVLRDAAVGRMDHWPLLVEVDL